MGEIVIATSNYHREDLIVGDKVGNENGKVDTDEEFLAAAENYCMKELQYCKSFFTHFKDSGFTKYQMKDLFVPGSKLFATTDSRVDSQLKELKSAEMCEGAAYELNDLVRYDISTDLKEKILDGALIALDGKKKAIRLSAINVLEALAASDIPADSKAKMIDPLVNSIGRDYYIYDYDNTQIPPALGHIAKSDVPVEKKLEMVEAVMKKMRSKNKNTRGEAETTLHFIASDVCASDAQTFADLFVKRLLEGDTKAKLAALKGIYGLASSEAVIGVKAGTVEQVIGALDDKSRNVRLSAVSALAACVQAGLPPDKHVWAMDVMKWLMGSKDKKVRRLTVGMMSFIAEGMFSSKEVQVAMVEPLLEALHSGDRVMMEQAIQGLYHLFYANIIESADEKTVRIIIKLLKSDDDYARNAAMNSLMVLEKKVEEPLLGKIKNALKKGESYDAPEVLKVKGPLGGGDIKKSQKYVATFKFPEMPKKAIKIQPVINGWDQKKGKINGKKASAVVWMDWRDEYVMVVVKFYNAKGKFIGETMEFEMENPGYNGIDI